MKLVLAAPILLRPLPGGSLELLVHEAARVPATAYQVRLLERFEAPAEVEAVLAAAPFELAQSRRFLHACLAAGLLRPAEDDGRPSLADTRPVARGLFGAPPFEPQRPAAFTVLGVPWDGGTTGAPGARFGPAAVRQASEGLCYALDAATLAPAGFLDLGTGRRLLEGVTLADAGDVTVSPGEGWASLQPRITRAVQRLLEAGTLPLVIGGDHTLTAAVLLALGDRRCRVLQLDAHLDLADPEPGPHHGNVFAHVLATQPGVVGIHQLGVRGLVEAGTLLEPPRASALGLDQLRRRGPEAVAEALPDDLPYWVSVDIDVLDPVFAPSTGTPVPNGLFPHELKALLQALAEAREVLGIDVVEVGPSLGPSDGTAALALEALMVTADGMVRRTQRALAARDGGGDE